MKDHDHSSLHVVQLWLMRGMRLGYVYLSLWVTYVVCTMWESDGEAQCTSGQRPQLGGGELWGWVGQASQITVNCDRPWLQSQGGWVWNRQGATLKTCHHSLFRVREWRVGEKVEVVATGECTTSSEWWGQQGHAPWMWKQCSLAKPHALLAQRPNPMPPFLHHREHSLCVTQSWLMRGMRLRYVYPSLWVTYVVCTMWESDGKCSALLAKGHSQVEVSCFPNY